MRKQKNSTEEIKNILVLGGGFAGVRAALDIAEYLKHQPDYQVILVNRKDYHEYHAAFYEAATTQHGLIEARKVKKTVTVPLAQIFKRSTAKFYKAYIESIDLENGHVVTDSRIISYDYLVIAMGSVADYYGIPNLDRYGFPLKSLEDAIMIRNRVEEIISKKESGTFVIGGGGFAGAEFAGELHGLIKHECLVHGRNLENFKLVIVEGAPSLLPGLSERVAQILHKRLSGMNIEMRFSTLITEAGKDFVQLNKTERVDCDLLVWTGGVRSLRLPVMQDLERDKKDRTAVTDFLNLKKYPRVYLAGDNTGYIDPRTKKPVPQTAQEAIKMGAVVAKNVFRAIMDRPLFPYSPAPTRFVIPAGGKFAVVYTPNLIISGFAGWVARRFVDLKYFMSILPFFSAIRYWMFENRMFTKND